MTTTPPDGLPDESPAGSSPSDGPAPETAPRRGRVTLVGGGPGDPELVTVAGMRALQEADVVVYDRLAPQACLAAARPDAKLVDAGKEPRRERTTQEAINDVIVREALAGKHVVRFKGGDPFVFGRGGEEWQACADAGIPVRVVPGVSSAIAVPAAAGIPVTHRTLTQGFTVVSGHVPPEDPRCTVDWDAIARSGTTLVLLMAVANLAAITRRLLAAGLGSATPAAVVTRGWVPGTSVLRAPLAQLAAAAADAGVTAPAVVVVGDVVDLRLAVVPGLAPVEPPATR